MGDKPVFRIYVSEEDGTIDFKKNEFCALWQNTSKGGKPYYSGKLKDGRKVQMWAAAKAESAAEERTPPEGVPF